MIDAEIYVRDQHRPEAQTGGGAEEAADKDEHEHQRDAGDDIRIDHRDVGHGVHQRAQIPAAQLVDADRGGGAHDRGDQGSAHGEEQRVAHGAERVRVTEQLAVPVKREAGENRKALGLVEGEDQQDRDGREEEEHHERGIEAGERFHFHAKASSQTAARLFAARWATAMQASRMTIRIKAMAAAKCRLLATYCPSIASPIR